MDPIVDRTIEFLGDDLFNKGRNHVLLYGDPQKTNLVLKAMYDAAREREEFLCSWHNASTIAQPMDFFEPILRLKYGNEYESLREKSWFKDLTTRNEKGGVFQLARLCGREENSENQHARSLPIIFIEGIEELFFKMDYGHLNEEGRKKLLTSSFMEQPLSKGFGDCLRGSLHQTKNGIFYGTVRNSQGIPFEATFGNYHYLFYSENFMEIYL